MIINVGHINTQEHASNTDEAAVGLTSSTKQTHNESQMKHITCVLAGEDPIHQIER